MVTKGITLSMSDPAGLNIFEILLNKGFKETDMKNIFVFKNLFLIVIDPLIVPDVRYQNPSTPYPYPIDYDKLSELLELEYIVVASRHWAQSGRPSLTVHSSGNFGKPMYGGRQRELQFTSPQPMRNIYKELSKNPPNGFKLSLEATHHSPTQFNTPLFFVEIGSRKEKWEDKIVGEYLVDAILNGILSDDIAPVAIGFGGGHYCPKFSEMVSEYAMGHIAAKYVLDLLDDDLIHQMIKKSPDAEIALTDGLKQRHKKKIQNLLRKHDMPLK
jgi:D-aminoacyl-tRNA deacylase